MIGRSFRCPRSRAGPEEADGKIGCHRRLVECCSEGRLELMDLAVTIVNAALWRTGQKAMFLLDRVEQDSDEGHGGSRGMGD